MNMIKLKYHVKKLLSNLRIGPFHSLSALSAALEFGPWALEHGLGQELAGSEALHCFVNNELGADTPISYLEFGVYKGASIKRWTSLNTHPDSRFAGFDTFHGLPEDWHNFTVTPKGTFDVGGDIPQVNDPRLRFFKGLFQETLPGFLKTFSPQSRLLIHCDADIYSATLYVLTSLNAWLVPGSIIIFDDFTSYNNEFRAFMNFTQAYVQLKYKVLGSCVSQRKFLSPLAIKII